MGLILPNMVFSKIGEGGSWEESQIGMARLPDFFAYVEQKGVFYFVVGILQCSPYLEGQSTVKTKRKHTKNAL
jgi:hypothetical protein